MIGGKLLQLAWHVSVAVLAVVLVVPIGTVSAVALDENTTTEEATTFVSEVSVAIVNNTENENHEPSVHERTTIATAGGSNIETPAVVYSHADSIVITEIQTRSPVGATDERIVLFNPTNDPVDMTNWCVQYGSAVGSTYSKVFCVTSSDGKSSTRVLLAPHSWLVAGTNNSATLTHDILFSSAMAENGKLRLVNSVGGTVDLVGWGGANEYLGSGPASSSTSTMSLQRVVSGSGVYQNSADNSIDFRVMPLTREYQTGALYEATDFCVNMPGIQTSLPSGMVQKSNGDCVERASINFCDGIRLSEVGANTTRQYIELHNTTKYKRDLTGCALQTNRSATVFYIFENSTLDANEFIVVYIDQTKLKLTKTTTGTVYLVASDLETEVDSQYYEDLSSDTSWSYFGDGWKQTYVLTPGGENTYAKYPPCGVGQERNMATGRCRNSTSITGLKPCREGQYRSEETNRCRSIALAVSTRKPCADDQFRNPLTNRCKKIASADEVKDCGEGRERNPQTNRCRNVIRSDVPEAAFAVEPIKQTGMAFAGWWALGGVLILASGYAGWEWRYEIRSGLRTLGQHFGRMK